MSDIRYPFLDLGTINARYAQSLHDAALRVIDSGRYIGGREIESFNTELARICNVPYAIGVSNGLDALRLIFEGYKAIGHLKEGDEVIIPANTYIASVLAATHAGLTPVLVDPDEQTMNISADSIIRSMTERTRAVMPVHLYGRIAWDEKIRDVVDSHNLLVIEDAAQAIGAEADCDGLFGSRTAGSIGHAGGISFYPTKNIGALGDAGAVTTHDKDLADAVRALANYGGDRRYHNIYTGFNCRLDPIQAAMLKVKLKDLSDCNIRRRKRAETYSRHINNPLVVTPKAAVNDNRCVWHQYVVRILDNQRDNFRLYLSQNSVETDIHYATPPHMQPCYKNLPHQPLNVTERLADEIVSLPISDCTSTDDVMEICRIINNFK